MKENKKHHKVLLLFLSAVLLVVVTVFSTLAFLTSQDKVINTFTVGNVNIVLDEAKMNTDGLTLAGGRTTDADSVNKYHLVPGKTHTKDPTVTVKKGSEDTYVRMIVTVNNISNLEAAMPKSKFPSYYDNDVFLLQKLTEDENGIQTWKSGTWVFYETKVDTVANTRTYEFRNPNVITKDISNDTKLDYLFEKITVPKEINNNQIKELEKVTIDVTAHAIQTDGFVDNPPFTAVEAAWNAFDSQLSTNP